MDTVCVQAPILSAEKMNLAGNCAELLERNGAATTAAAEPVVEQQAFQLKPMMHSSQVIQLSEAGHHWAAAAMLIANARYSAFQGRASLSGDDAEASVTAESFAEQQVFASTPLIRRSHVIQLSETGHHWAAAAVLIANARYSKLQSREKLVCSISPHGKRQRI